MTDLTEQERPAAPADLREVVTKELDDVLLGTKTFEGADPGNCSALADAVLSAIASHGYEVVPAGAVEAYKIAHGYLSRISRMVDSEKQCESASIALDKMDAAVRLDRAATNGGDA